jgi:cytochrome P450
MDVSRVRLAAPELLDDPYGAYAAIRETGGIVWSETYKAWLIGSYDYVRSLLSDPRLSAEKIEPFVSRSSGETREQLSRMQEIMRHWVVFQDPPHHTRTRRILQRCFLPREVRKLEGGVRAAVLDLLRGFDDRAEIEFMEEFACQLPSIVIADLFGVPRADVSRIKLWSDQISKFVLGSPRGEAKYGLAFSHMEEMNSYFEAFVAARIAGGPTVSELDFLDLLLASRNEPDGLSEEEIVSTLVLVLFAGHETTADFIGNSMLALVRNRPQLELMAADPSLIPAALEELLRFDGPVPLVVRVCKEELPVGGETLASGDRVFLLLNAANRDGQRFDHADVLDVERGKCPHLEFGAGTHMCLGAPLARLEARIAFEELLRRYSGFALVDEEIDWRDELMTRGPRTLPLRVTRRSPDGSSAA